jgi:GNAT superfamily N-acetyltransferase
MKQALADGLILRSLSEGVATDAERLPKFYQDTFGEAGEDDQTALGEWTRTLISGRHPATTYDDVWVVVDPARDDEIISAVLLIPQTWQVEDIPVGVGRIELVATNKEYRRRGLVRQLIDVAHQRSAELGHIMQSITGISNYYRRFGYAMAVELGSRVTIPFFGIPDLPEGETLSYTLRRAKGDDAAKLAAWDVAYAPSAPLRYPRDEATWRFELMERHRDEVWMPYVFIITDREGEELGYVLMRAVKETTWFACYSWVMNEHASLISVYVDVLRGLKAFAQDFYRELEKPLPEAIYFSTTLPETFDDLVLGTPGGRLNPALYAWYLRVPDLAGFIQHITPVLERRLANSPAHGHTGTLTISLYDLTGLELTFEKGKLTKVEHRAFKLYEGDVGFPDYTFLNLLFGHRTQQEIAHLYADAGANAKARALLPILFPKGRAWLYPLG